MANPQAEVGMLSIGALARATGIPVATLRTWERRYGFPRPERRESGHRRYPEALVGQLRLVRRALDEGHKPSQVLGLTLEQLTRRLAIAAPEAAAPRAAPLGDLFESVAALDAEALEASLRRHWHVLGALAFVETLAVPFLAELGDRWERGELGVMHEHFASQVMTSFLAGLWRPLSEASSGAPVLLAGLPGEEHTLGLHLGAALVALAGFRVQFLGANTPVDDIVRAHAETGAQAVVLGSSLSADADQVREMVREIRAGVPAPAPVLLGGGEDVTLPGVLWLSGFSELARWADARAAAQAA